MHKLTIAILPFLLALPLGAEPASARTGHEDPVAFLALSRQLLDSARLADSLPGPSKAHASEWLTRIEKVLRKGKRPRAARLARELHAALAKLAGNKSEATPAGRAGLVETPADLLAPEEMNNVELVEPGVLAGGSQPSGRAWELIRSKGFKTVVNLRRESDEERKLVGNLGMRYEYIPVTDHKAPTRKQAIQFIRIVDDPANQPVFVHCQGGVGRTHTMIGAWRLAHGATLEAALSEAAEYGHHKGPQVKFLRRFAEWRKSREEKGD
ncbi:MAG: dual specificity protein phosphatase family protein [Candidatus Wallbacteria bacterium]|nr:dual specificity protein phosphatase family protein [Candidatus Wallbacteria bacterium]